MAVVGIPFRRTAAMRSGVGLRWYDADESNFVEMKAPATISADVSYLLPGGPPAANGYVLSATTAGVMSWVAQSGGGSGEVNVGQNLGLGAPLYKGKSGVALQFSTVLGGVDEAGQRTIGLSNTTNEVVVRAYGTVPVGAVIGWFKNLPGVPSTLPDGFVVCDGRTISDGASPLNGVTIPNLINQPADGSHAAGANRFLRGDTTSGQIGGADSHAHQLINTFSLCQGTTNLTSVAQGNSATSIASNVPQFYSVVWIMRIK